MGIVGIERTVSFQTKTINVHCSPSYQLRKTKLWIVWRSEASFFFLIFIFFTSRFLSAFSFRLIAFRRRRLKSFYFTDRLYEVNLFSPAVCSISWFSCQPFKEKVGRECEKSSYKIDIWKVFRVREEKFRKIGKSKGKRKSIQEKFRINWITNVSSNGRKLTILSIATVPMQTSGSLKYEHICGRKREKGEIKLRFQKSFNQFPQTFRGACRCRLCNWQHNPL